MSTIISDVVGRIERIPWKEYLKTQIYKLFGIICVSILIIGVMILSEEMGPLEEATIEDPNYILAVLLSSLSFILVLIGFTKIVIFDMANEFGLRDEETNKIIYDTRFFLFTSLSLSFCSSIYLLLDVFLQNAYLELLPVLLMEWLLITTEADIPGLTDIGGGRIFYQTARNIYFAFFFFIIVAFSVFVFLAILTTLGRRRITSYGQKEEVKDEEVQNRSVYKFLTWIAIPIINIFLFNLLETPIGPIVVIIFLLLGAWWVYQLLKTIFLIIWRGFKITAFITSVNALLIIPLILVLYGLPVITWTGWDILQLIREGIITFSLTEIVQSAIPIFQERTTDIFSIIQLDFVFITMVATIIVGFAEGFAIIAIFTAIFRGVEVARTGRIVSRSPPKIAVITKYILMFGVWLSLVWDSFLEIWNLLIEHFQISLPKIMIPSLFYFIYYEIIVPLSSWLETLLPTFRFIPLLIIPLYFILAGSFKFLSVTIVTPRVKRYLSIFFLLVSTAFVLIITNILGDLYKIQAAEVFTGIQDAPLKSLFLSDILTSAVDVFQYAEAIAFYAGFLFGIIWVIYRLIRSSKDRSIVTYAPKTEVLPSIDSSDRIQQMKERVDLTSEDKNDSFDQESLDSKDI